MMTGNPIAVRLALALGILLLSVLHFYRNKYIHAIFAGKETSLEEKRKLICQPVIEIGFGFIFTFSCLYFAVHAFTGKMNAPVAFLIALVVSATSSWGAYARYARFFKSMAEKAEITNRLPVEIQIFTSIGQFLITAMAVLELGRHFLQ